MVTDLSSYAWRSDISKIKILDETRFVEYTKDGYKTLFSVTKKEPYKIWEFKMENENMKGVWSGRFLGKDGHMTLDFTENVTAKKFYLKPFVGKYLRGQQRRYFVDLKKELKCEEAGEMQAF